MSKIVFLFGFLSFVNGISQCYILGKPSIKAGETETYTVEKDIAQCGDCHLWTTHGGNVTLQGNVKQNSIKLTGNTGGQTILSLAMLAPQGMVQCSKIVEVTEPVKNITIYKTAPGSTNANCDIDFNEYQELKVADGMVLFSPTETERNYKYEWTVIYSDGEQKQSTEKKPQFPFSQDHGIISVAVKMISGNCMRTFTKTYDSNFWNNF